MPNADSVEATHVPSGQSHRRLRHVEVIGLFGFVDHAFDVSPVEPTILTGPNGVGKTQVLGLIRAALKLDITSLVNIPFKMVTLLVDGGRGMTVERLITSETEPPQIKFQVIRQGVGVEPPCLVSLEDEESPQTPENFHELPDGTWFDTNSDRFFSAERVTRLFGRRGAGVVEGAPHGLIVVEFVKQLNPIFIDTKRLDTIYNPRLDSARARTSSMAAARVNRGHGRGPVSRIEQYVDQLRSQVAEARTASISETQSADLSFAVRALAAAHDRVNEKALRRRYGEIVSQYEALTRNGLATGEEPLLFPDDTTPTVRRILNVFLDDWERRLRPLLPVNRRLTVLRSILDDKFASTGKKTWVGSEGRLAFRDARSRPIPVQTLSSGEQHLVALYTMLVFSAPRGSLLLIDEPEISMHAAWKHAFLTDMAEVGELSNLQVMIATHSTGIINGRWDLTVELSAGAMIGTSDFETALVDGDVSANAPRDGDDWLD